MADHAFLSPSAFERTVACPGSPTLNADMPRKSSVYAAEGTLVHTLAAAELLSPTVVSPVGEMHVVDGFNFIVTPEMEEHARGYAAYVRKLGGWLRVEQKVSLEWLAPGLWGTADAILLDVEAKRLHVVDLKYGAGKRVNAELNWQMIIYGLAALGRTNWAEVTELVMHVYQPRMSNVSSWDLPVADVPMYHQRIVDAVNRVREAESDPWSYVKAGDHCTFCPQKGKCPALREKAVGSAQMVFGASPRALPTVSLGDILRHAELIDTWIGAVREEAYDRAMAGERVEGFKLVPKRASRVWANETAVRGLGGMLGVQVLDEPKMLSPAALEKSLGKKKFAELAFDKEVTSVSSGLTLVEAGDKRQAVDPKAHGSDGAMAVFKPIEGISNE